MEESKYDALAEVLASCHNKKSPKHWINGDEHYVYIEDRKGSGFHSARLSLPYFAHLWKVYRRLASVYSIDGMVYLTPNVGVEYQTTCSAILRDLETAKIRIISDYGKAVDIESLLEDLW